MPIFLPSKIAEKKKGGEEEDGEEEDGEEEATNQKETKPQQQNDDGRARIERGRQSGEGRWVG
jgi:hypothetical protein